MVNGEHKKLDFDYVVDGEVCSELFYFVDGIYPSLSCFISSESATNQESLRKDVERSFGALKIKFLTLTHPINLHHRDNIYYLILGAILQHIMIVESRLKNGEEESGISWNV